MKLPLALLFSCAIAAVHADDEEAPRTLSPIVVTPAGTAQDAFQTGPAVARVEGSDIDQAAHVHPAEIRVGLPAVWVSRGSGQEHLMAIRSPVLTGAGSCGAFAYLENGVPVRPASFCNVNQLIEINTEQAGAIEVVRGPGPVLYGSNALHGVYHVLSPAQTAPVQRFDAGPDDFYRLALDGEWEASGARWRARAHGEHDGGFRDDSGYGQSKINLDYDGAIGATTMQAFLAATLLNQETAGFVIGRDAFRDDALRFTNPNPEAYRDADSQRFSMRFETPGGTVLQPYLRRSAMVFLQHFLPGQPLEENGHRSAGILWRSTPGDNWIVGADLDLASIYLRETQAEPITDGSPFLQATRPAGAHYDFEVDAFNAALYARRTWRPAERHTVFAGLRVEHAVYDYDNALADGNLDASGQPCGFGGCLYTRPADRRDRFTNLAPKLEWRFAASPNTAWFARISRGFRAPQVTELYRLQSGQTIADLDSETLDALEVGVRSAGRSWRLGATAYSMRKRNVILRDAEGFNVSDGRTDHVGAEFDALWRPHPALSIAASAALSRHRYAFDRDAGRGETIRDGRDVDTAPRTLAGARMAWQLTPLSSVSLEWEHMGRYYLDAANEHRYGGHDLLHLGASQRVGSVEFNLRVRNLLDAEYADRADFAFGNYRYFPGRPRSVFLSLAYRP